MNFFSKNPYRALEKKLGYRFRKKTVLAPALVHPSYRFEQACVDHDNQRLEFLGDAALSLVCGDYLYRTYSQSNEGRLTRLRSRLTCGRTLSQVATSLELGSLMQLGRGERRNGGQARPSLLADAMEAVLGAAYLDGGLKAVAAIFSKLFVPLLDDDIIGDEDNPKGQLQELAQRRWKTNPTYTVTATHGPPHAKRFRVQVSIQETPYATGESDNRRSAEQDAARRTLDQLRSRD